MTDLRHPPPLAPAPPASLTVVNRHGRPLQVCTISGTRLEGLVWVPSPGVRRIRMRRNPGSSDVRLAARREDGSAVLVWPPLRPEPSHHAVWLIHPDLSRSTLELGCAGAST